MRKFSLLLALLCASVMGFAVQYCELPTGHLGDANFGDASGRVLLTLQKDGNNVIVKLKNNTANGNPQTGLNYMWVNATGATNNNATYGSHSTANTEEISVTVEFSEDKDSYTFNNIHWAYEGFGGEWALDGLTVSASELCAAAACADNENPTISAVATSDITYNSAVLTVTASDNIGVTGYIVKNGASQIASSATSPITITGLTAATTYDNIKVIAKDACNNESAEFAVTSFTTSVRSFCSFATGHLGNAAFGDANGRILLTLTKLSASSVGVTVEPNNGGADVFDFVEVILGGVSHTLGAVGGSAPTNTEIVFDGLASLDFSINVLWHNHNWADVGGRWTTQSFAVTEAELCPGPINSEYCNYQGAETHQDDHYFAITFETDASGNVVITIGDGAGAGACSFRNGGFEGGNNGLNNFVVSDDDFATTTPATDYFTVTRPTDGDLQYVMTKIADLPANAKIKHLSAGAIAWREAGADRWCFPEFIYTYGGTCNQLDAPTNVSIDANNIITFDDVTGATSYTAFVSLSGVQKYSQAVASGDELLFVPLVDGDYDVTVVASGTGKTDSDPSSAFVWSLTATPVVLGNSEYCEHIMSSGNTQAAFTWETDGSGNIVITISETLGGAADAAHFRGNGMALGNFKVGAGQAAGSNYFSHPGTTTGNQLVLTATNAPAPGEKIYYNGVVEYATSLDGNAWPTLQFEWTYGTECSGISVSATPNNNTMGTAVVQKAGVDVTNVEDGDEVSFIATVADAELYRFINWTKGGVEVSTNATYVTTITETTNLVANFDYIRNTYCHSEITSIQGKKLFMTLGAIGGGQYQIKFEGSAEAPLTALTNANYTVNWVTTDIVDGEAKMSGQDVPFANARWSFNAAGYGSATAVFGIADGHTWEDIYVWNHAIYFMTDEGEVGYTGFPGRYHIAWNETCSDAEAPVFAKAEAAVIDGSSVRLTIQASDNWEGMLTYTIARESADPIISNHASGEEFTQDVTGLTAGTEYTFTVSVSDGVNVTNQSIVVTPEADTQAPVMGAASLDSKTWNSAIINVAATDNLGVASFYIVELDADFVASEGKITVDGLTQGTAYSFTIKAKDGAGNPSENSASVNFTTDAHLTAPATAAPVPTRPAALVKSLYSDSYLLAPSAIPNYNDCWWGCPNANEGDVEGNNYMLYDLYRNGMIGVSFANISVATMEKIHIDIWSSAAGTVTFRPITTGGPNDPQTLNLLGQQWNSFDLDMSVFDGHNWADLFQYAFEYYQAGGLVGEYIAVDNIFFYRESELSDSEAPTNVTATAANSFYSVKITAQAEDNSGAVNFSVKNGDTEVATGAAASGAATTITVNNLTPGTAYNFNVIASDDAGNEAAPVAVAANTLAAPAAAPVPTEDAANVMAVFSDAYTPVVTVGNYCEWWWESPNVHNVTLGSGDNARFYDNNHSDVGSFGWAWDANNKIDFSGFQKFHLHIYPALSGTIEIYPVIAPEGEFHKVSQTLTAGQWNEIVLDYTDKTFAPLNQIGFVNFFGLGDFFIDNVYFFAEAPEKEVIRGELSNGKWGTLCPKQTVEDVEGAVFYQISYLEEQGGVPYNMVFDEISGTTLTAGQPYFFIANATEIRGNKTGAELSVAGDGVNGFYGYIGATSWELPYVADYNPAVDNTFVIYNNSVFRINQAGTMLKSERCYIKINASVPSRAAMAPVPGRRRITMGVQNTDAATGIEDVQGDNVQCTKVLINGQFFILRGENTYDATGRLVK